MNKNFKKTILSISLFGALSLSTVALADSDSFAPNEYDCTPEELTSYIEKKSESIVQRDTAITDFESFKIATQGVGSNLDTYSSTGGIAGGSSLVAEDCDYFWGDIDDISIDTGLFDKILGVLDGDMGGIYDMAADRIAKVADGMLTSIKKGLCNRLSTSAVKKQVYKYGNEMMKQQTGYNSRVLTDPNIVINDVLSDNLGSTGRLLNIADPRLDSARAGAVSREEKRQIDSIMKMN